MPCSVGGCFTNFKGHPTGTVFEFTKDVDLKPIWRKFLNRQAQDVDQLKTIFVCEKHFEEKYVHRNAKYPRLLKHLKPIPTIPPDGLREIPSLQPSVHTLRKAPKQRIFQEDELETFKKQDEIKDFGGIDQTLIKYFGYDYLCSRYEDHAIFYKMEKDSLSVPEITHCIRIDSNLHVKLYHKRCPIPLPEWFRRANCKLSSKSMLENFPIYIQQESERFGGVLDELRQLKYKTSPVYSANLIRYALMLRYTSLPAYKLLMEEFKLPSVSLLRRITAGKLDALKTAKVLRENGNISEDVILMFDEMFLQKCEEYSGGESVGADENGELYKGVVSFMIVGLKSNVPYIVKALPEKEIDGVWLKDELLDCINILQGSGFNIRGIVCDDHPSNVNAYKQLLTTCGQARDELFVNVNGKKIYVFRYCSPHQKYQEQFTKSEKIPVSIISFRWFV